MIFDHAQYLSHNFQSQRYRTPLAVADSNKDTLYMYEFIFFMGTNFYEFDYNWFNVK